MKDVLLDTSTILDLALAVRDNKGLRNDKAPGAFEALEALLLYDNVVYDLPSIEAFCQEELSSRLALRYGIEPQVIIGRIHDIRKLCNPLEVPVDYTKALYQAVQEILDERVAAPQFRAHRDSHGSPFQYDEIRDLGKDRKYKEPYPRAYELVTNDGFITVEEDESVSSTDFWIVTLKFSNAHPVVRALYYELLQTAFSLHYIPHPVRARLLAPKGPYTMHRRLIDYFDHNVRRRFEERKKMILGDTLLQIPAPLVGSYLLKDVASWNRLMERLDKTRASRKAVRFRRAVSELEEMILNRRNQDLDKVMSELASSAEDWQRNLTPRFRTKRITVHLPVIGVSTDIDVPLNRFPRGVAGDILIFIHMLLSDA